VAIDLGAKVDCRASLGRAQDLVGGRARRARQPYRLVDDSARPRR
jgi:hypothetical protein